MSTGSVGRPKDENARSGYVVVNVAAEQTGVEFMRVKYEVELATRATEASSLPSEFAADLRTGRKPG